ncbi:MAG: hypothetical protein IJX18_01190 [Clostridia bacterium]|nr:hypothetical protein [Clostridia bacterium]
MKEEFQVEKEISIMEILRALLSNVIYLILALILGAIAGGVYVYMTSKDVVSYGTSLTFYINPSTDDKVETESIFSTYGSYSKNVMNNMVGLLESERFAAILLDGMMERGVEGTPTAKYQEDGKLNGGYKTWLGIISSAAKFSFASDGNIAESFVKVSISLDGATNGGKGKMTAEQISLQIQETVPEFVESYMPKPSGYTGTNCELMTEITDVTPTNSGYANSEMTKYAMIVGAVAFIVAAIVVIVMHMSDKRLRDVDEVTKAFNLPVLGVIPTIEEEELKKSSQRKGGKA